MKKTNRSRLTAQEPDEQPHAEEEHPTGPHPAARLGGAMFGAGPVAGPSPGLTPAAGPFGPETGERS